MTTPTGPALAYLSDLDPILARLAALEGSTGTVTTLASETWTGADNAAWPAQWTVSGGITRITSNQGVFTSGTGSYTTPAVAVLGGLSIVNAEIALDAYPESPAVEQELVVGLRTSSPVLNNSYPNTGLFVEIVANTGAVTLRHGLSGTYTTTGTATYGGSLTAGVRVWLKTSGSTVEVRMAAAGAARPASALVSATDNAIPGTGNPFLSANSGIGAHTWKLDNLTVVGA